MVAARESTDDSLRNGFCIEVNMGEGDDLIFGAVVEEDGNVHRNAR